MDAPRALEVVVDGARDGARNMAVDHALMDRAREGRACLRLYRWDPPCLSFGRNQRARGRYRRDALRRLGAQVVRRPTGGRAVFHHRELTYAFVAPDARWGTLRESYLRINRALAGALRELGVPAEIQEERARDRSPGPTTRACFRDPLPGEIVVEGRKLVGSAQWRNDGALLQHGSILMDDDQAVAEELRTEGAEGCERGTGADGGRRRVRAASLAACLDELPETETVASALRDGFARELELEAVELDDAPGLRRLATEHLNRYRDEEWTWRR